MATLGNRLTNPENNFDFLRHIAAAMVIFGHSYPMLGVNPEPYSKLSGYIFSGGLAVQIFFVISGFLITYSWIRKPVIEPYVKNRVLRIFPAFIVNLLLTVLVLGPIVTTLSLHAYFHSNPWLYLKSVFLYPIYGSLPGVFTNTPLPGVNGVFWSLQAEVALYVLILGLGITRLIRWPMTMVFIGLLFLIANLHQIPIFPHKLALALPQQFLPFSIYFVIGSLFFLYRDHIVLRGEIALIALILFLGTFHSAVGSFISCFTLPYLVLYFAFCNLGSLANFGKHGDFSYGIYIYAFPVQETLVYYFQHKLTPITLFISAYFITLIIAILSWHFVEKPMLKLKRVKINPIERLKHLFAENKKGAI
jgi:peptidoglycan/LPS O-acetylase OafA/YrhL